MFGRLLNASRRVFTFRAGAEPRGDSQNPTNGASSNDNLAIPVETSDMATTRSRSEVSNSTTGASAAGVKRKRANEEDVRSKTRRPKSTRVNMKYAQADALSPPKSTATIPDSGRDLPLRPHEYDVRVNRAANDGHAGEPTDTPETDSSVERRSKRKENLMASKLKETSQSYMEAEANKLPPASIPSRHIRFGSEDPATDNELVANTSTSLDRGGAEPREQTASEDESVPESEDAPEMVSTSQGQERARASAATVTRAIRSQRKLDKDTRRKRDSQLKQQSKTATEKHDFQLLEAKHQPDADENGRTTTRKLLDAEKLPDFLPIEILAAEPAKVPTRPMQISPDKLQKRTRLIQESKKKPQDVKSGGRVIRVLDVSNDSQGVGLSGSSKETREQWLAGRRGGSNGVAASRKPVYKGFVRR